MLYENLIQELNKPNGVAAFLNHKCTYGEMIVSWILFLVNTDINILERVIYLLVFTAHHPRCVSFLWLL